MKKKLLLEPPFGERRILLHTCCAPCSSAIVECLTAAGFLPTIYYCNANIYPREEYDTRRTECERYARALGLDVVEDVYDHEAWLESIRGLEDEPERGGRCLRCFRFRLRRAAAFAHEQGFRVLTTTLASSRWKSLEQINDAGVWACSAFDDVAWWNQNWRKGGLSERRAEIIRTYNFYNQQYCGCEFSLRAAEAWRRQKAERAAER